MSELASLVARRLCHDFAGPIGAIATAVELLAVEDNAEIRGLIGDSARGLAAALRLYRVILAPGDTPVTSHEAETLLRGWVDTREGLSLDWQMPPGLIDAPHVATLLGLSLIACEALSRGGTLVVSEDHVAAEGPNLRFDSEVRDAFSGTGTVGTTGSSPRASLARLVVAHTENGGGAVHVHHSGTELRLHHRRSTPVEQRD
jgi:histidine phosphotransferase ChpT